MSIIQLFLIAFLLFQLALFLFSFKAKLFLNSLIVILLTSSLLSVTIFDIPLFGFIQYLGFDILGTLFLFFLLLKSKKISFHVSWPEEGYSFVLVILFFAVFLIRLFFKEEFTLNTILSESLIFLVLGFSLSKPMVNILFANKKLSADFKFLFVHQLSKLRTIAIERIYGASTAIFERKHYTQRRTISEKRLESLLSIMFVKFYPLASNCFKKEMDFEVEFENQIENKYISCKDSEGNKYELVCKELIGKDMHPLFNFFLLKEEQLAASMSITDGLDSTTEDFFKWANKKGYNTVLFNNSLPLNSEIEEEYSIFDKIYQVLNTEKDALLLKLNHKAPTVLIRKTNEIYALNFWNAESLKFERLEEFAKLLNTISIYIRKMSTLLIGFKTIQFLLFLSVFFSPFHSFKLMYSFLGFYIFTIILINYIKFRWKN